MRKDLPSSRQVIYIVYRPIHQFAGMYSIQEHDDLILCIICLSCSLLFNFILKLIYILFIRLNYLYYIAEYNIYIEMMKNNYDLTMRFQFKVERFLVHKIFRRSFV